MFGQTTTNVELQQGKKQQSRISPFYSDFLSQMEKLKGYKK